MRPLLLRFVALAITLSAIACVDSRPTQPSVPGATLAKGRASQAEINQLINALFAPTEQGKWFAAFARIKNAVARGDSEAAGANIIAFVSNLLGAFPGAQPAPTAKTLQELVNAVAMFGGLPAPLPGTNPLLGGGAVAVIGTAGGQVVTSDGFGGVAIPSGALATDVIVVVERLPNPATPGAGPLPTTLRQLPLFYQVTTVPAVAQFAVPVTIAACQLEVGDLFGPASQAEANRLQLAQPDPSDPTGVALLPRVAAPFLDCDGITLSAARFESGDQSVLAKALGFVGQGGTEVLDLLRPSVAHAIHGGLGGTTSAFGPFGAVVPGGVTPEHGILAVGVYHVCVIETIGTTVCWGDRAGTGLGGGTLGTTGRMPVAGNPIFTSIFTNGFYTCGRTPAAADLCWGRDPVSWPLTVFRDTPTALSHGPYLQVSSARLVACALTPSNAAVCWGLNQLGEWGDGTQPTRPMPTHRPSPGPVATSLAFEAIETSWLHSCAVTFAGAAHCWGAWQGQGAPFDVVPVAVPGGQVFSRLYSGGTHTCGITDTNETWCWGDNASGQLGSGTAGTGGGTPARVTGGHRFVMMATGLTGNAGGNGFTCGLTDQGQVLCWGLNDQGQLGNGTTTNQLLPTPILSGEVFVAVDGGDHHACAMTVDRRVFCWGSNAEGELGSGTAGGFSAVPVLVP